MGIKKDICKFVGEVFLDKELYEYKKEIRSEIEETYKSEIEMLKKLVKEKQNLIDNFVKESQKTMECRAIIQAMENKERRRNYLKNVSGQKE